MVGQLADLAVAEFFAHAVKGGLVAELGNALLHYVYHRGVVRGVNFGVYACFVAFEPDFFHVAGPWVGLKGLDGQPENGIRLSGCLWHNNRFIGFGDDAAA